MTTCEKPLCTISQAISTVKYGCFLQHIFIHHRFTNPFTQFITSILHFYKRLVTMTSNFHAAPVIQLVTPARSTNTISASPIPHSSRATTTFQENTPRRSSTSKHTFRDVLFYSSCTRSNIHLRTPYTHPHLLSTPYPGPPIYHATLPLHQKFNTQTIPSPLHPLH